jgi:hypothetical protein
MRKGIGDIPVVELQREEAAVGKSTTGAVKH